MDKGALFGKYEVGRLLGCGAFAKVYYARNMKNGQSVAIKVINKKKIAGTSLMSNIKREITIMRRLRHPNIVCLHEVLATKCRIYFVMDLVKGGELFAKVAKGRFTESLTRKYFQQLISAVGYCHSQGVYHRDLKPENLLVDENGDLKVTDFGLSALKDSVPGDGVLHTLCGTPAYVAPEILSKRGYNGAKVDIWSCGIILYVLTAGYLPFNDPNLMVMYKKIYKGEFRCPKWMSSDLKRFLCRLLDTNPKTRITIDQVICDPWFTKGGVFKGQDSLNNFSFQGYSAHLDNDGDKAETSKATSLVSSDQLHEQNNYSINAFDLISFSSGLNLSGLFDDSYNPIMNIERFLLAQPMENVLHQIEEATTPYNVKLKKNKDFVVDLEGPSGHFLAKLEVSPLTDQLLVVEVIKKGGDSDSFNFLWDEKIKPQLCGLLDDSKSQVSYETIDLNSSPEDPLIC